MFTDTYPVKDFNDLLWEVEAKHVTQKSEKLDGSLFGANASAEEAPEADDEATSQSGLNVHIAHKYTETGFPSKKDFVKGIGAFLKEIIAKKKEKGEEVDEAAFKTAHSEMVKKTLLPIYSDLQFFMGESMNSDGTLAMLLWKKEGDKETPFYLYFKCGIFGEKF